MQAPPKPQVDDATLLASARAAIAKGGDRTKIIARLRSWNIDPKGL
jgi:hypothetical protein